MKTNDELTIERIAEGYKYLVDETDEVQEGLFQDNPPKIEPSDYWTLIKVTLKKDQKYGDDLLKKHGGDFEAAYHAASKAARGTAA